MAVSPAPITQPLIDDQETGLPSLQWSLFFNQNFNGDAGTEWNPIINNLTGTTESVTGRYYRLSQFLVYFVIRITPNGNTSSTAGTTNVANFPLDFKGDSFNTVIAGAGGGAIGANTQTNNLILFPAWTDVSVPLTVVGIGEAS